MTPLSERSPETQFPLELSRKEMDRLGQAVLECLVEHRSQIGAVPVSRVLSRREADELLDEPLPRGASDPEQLVHRLKEEVFVNISHVDHPRFFAFVPGPGNFVAAMATALAAGHNVFAGTWLGGSAAAKIEQVVLEWLAEALGYPRQAGGLFVSGGSMANLTALGAARHSRLGSHSEFGVVYYSSQTHSAVERALRVLGFPESCMRRIDTPPQVGMDPRQAREAIRADRLKGRRPLCLVANAGTTNSGAVDPLDALAELCGEEDIWMHVDGAYGAAAVFGPRARGYLKGIERADSVALDPHKWLFQPFESGCLLLRDAALLRDAYAIHPEYMNDTLREEEEINYCEYGVQLSRSFRALGLWMTMKTFGADAIGEAIDRGLTLAHEACAVIERMPGWEVVTPPSMAILTFRYCSGPPEELDRINAELVRRLRESGVAMVSSTLIENKYVLRLCLTNPRTTLSDVTRTLNTLDQLVSTRN